MPSAKILSEKQAFVAALKEKMDGAASVVVVSYKGFARSCVKPAWNTPW